MQNGRGEQQCECVSQSKREMRMPGFEPRISRPQREVLTTILHTPGEAGYRSQYLSHAKRALYHLSYIPILDHPFPITPTKQIHKHRQNHTHARHQKPLHTSTSTHTNPPALQFTHPIDTYSRRNASAYRPMDHPSSSRYTSFCCW